MIAIVILNYNTYKNTIKCVESIQEHTKDCEYEVFIVDNCSVDESYQKLRTQYQYHEGINVVRTIKNEGYSAGNNYICKKLDKSKYDKILIMNSDVYLLNNAVKIIEDTLQDKSIGVVGPSTVNEQLQEKQLLRKPFTFLNYFLYRKPFNIFNGCTERLSIAYPYPKDSGIFKFNGMVSGCCFMIRTDLLQKFDYLDENIFLYCEEWVLQKKLEKENLLVAFNSTAQVMHSHAVSTKKEGAAFENYHLYTSAFYYFRYYTKLPFIGLLLIYSFHLAIYGCRSIYQKSYRKYIKSFIRINTKILFSNKKVKIRM